MIRNVQLIVLIQALVSAEQRSFRKASEMLGVRTSTISRRVRELEDRLGIMIFQRHRHGIRPTDAGAAFLDEARRIVGDLESLVTNARAAGAGKTGRLRIGFYLSLSFGDLRDTLVEFIRQYPGVDLRVTNASRHRLIERLNTGALDVVIVGDDGTTSRLESLTLWRERVHVAFPSSHVLADQAELGWEDLRNEKFLLPEHDPGPELRDILVGCFSNGQTMPQLLQLGITREMAFDLVSFGCSLTLLFEADIGTAHPGVVYRQLDVQTPMLSAPYKALWQKENANPALASFLDLLHRRYSGSDALGQAAATPTAAASWYPARSNNRNRH